MNKILLVKLQAVGSFRLGVKNKCHSLRFHSPGIVTYAPARTELAQIYPTGAAKGDFDVLTNHSPDCPGI